MHVARLNVFPVKGCAGISVEEWPVDERGMHHDRRFMVIRPDGRFITQRDRAELALIQTSIVGSTLIISSAGHGNVEVPLAPTTGDRQVVSVWSDSVTAVLPSPQADDLLSRSLGEPARLAWMPDDGDRRTAEKRGLPQRILSFADATPMHVACEASLIELNRRLTEKGATPVTMCRFRANIVVAGAAVDEDDRWDRLAVGHIELRVTDSCKRCKVVTIDQTTGLRANSEPMETLKSYRFEEGPVSTGASFGQRCTVERGGRIRVGDLVQPVVVR